MTEKRKGKKMKNIKMERMKNMANVLYLCIFESIFPINDFPRILLIRNLMKGIELQPEYLCTSGSRIKEKRVFSLCFSDVLLVLNI